MIYSSRLVHFKSKETHWLQSQLHQKYFFTLLYTAQLSILLPQSGQSFSQFLPYILVQVWRIPMINNPSKFLAHTSLFFTWWGILDVKTNRFICWWKNQDSDWMIDWLTEKQHCSLVQIIITVLKLLRLRLLFQLREEKGVETRFQLSLFHTQLYRVLMMVNLLHCKVVPLVGKFSVRFPWYY